MNKFRQARSNQRKDQVNGELFADTMDKIARERLIKDISVDDNLKHITRPEQLICIVNSGLNKHYDDMMKNISMTQIEKYHSGIFTLYGYFLMRHELPSDPELFKTLYDINKFDDFNDYTYHLAINMNLESLILEVSEAIDKAFREDLQNYKK